MMCSTRCARLDLLAPGAAEEDHGIEHVGAQMGVPAGQDVLDHGAVLEQREVLKRAPDPDRGEPRGRDGREIGAVEQDAAAAWPQHAGDHVEQRGLAGAVRADHAADFA